MKKNVIALILSVVLASGSLGPVPAMAAETAETAETTENVQKEKEEASEAAGADAEGGSAETEEKAGEEDLEETDAASADEADETGEEVPEDPQIIETDDTAEDGADRTDEIVAADATAEEADPEAVTEETPESGTEDVPTVQNDKETADKDIKEEDTAEEPSNAEIAVNDNVKDEESDLKVAEDAEKLKGGKWKEVTKTVHHEEKGHYETETVQTGTRTVVDKEAWDEPVYEARLVCNVCGYVSDDTDEMIEHMADEHDADGSWYNDPVEVGSKHHDALTHEEPVYGERKYWVVDQEAWDEQVKTGTYQYIVNGKPVKNTGSRSRTSSRRSEMRLTTLTQTALR